MRKGIFGCDCGLSRGASMDALARAKRRREEAMEAQAEKLAADAARTLHNAERAKEHGLVEKTAGESGAAGFLRNKWVAFLESLNGKDIAARLAVGGAPTVDEAKAFSSWAYSTRDRWSRVGRVGMSDSMGQRQVPYMLAKYVFPLMKYDGYVGLTLAQAAVKNAEFCHELREHWKALKTQQVDASTEGCSMAKKKWDDDLYFMAQDLCMADSARPNRAAHRLAIMGFVRTTCCRSGSFSRDWFDRGAKAARWVGVNVLSVHHFEWDREGFVIEMPDGTMEESLAADVDIQRIKFHYFEKYVYGMAVTADALEVARRAATWLLFYMWRRGLFEVQYSGMSTEARAAAMTQRANGIAGGMPEGAMITSGEAFKRWLAGERGYAPELRKEPMFVRLDAAMQYTTVELHSADVLAVFAELGEELGVEPGASGLNSGRRNGVVGTSKALVCPRSVPALSEAAPPRRERGRY